MRLWELYLPNPAQSWGEMRDVTVLAAALWGEARGESFRGKLAVASVIRNRALNPTWWGSGWKGVILKPWQFSAFNPNDPNQPKLKQPLEYDSKAIWEECAVAAHLVYEDLVEDPTGGANHYHDTSVAPGWAEGHTPTASIGRLRFYGL